MKKVRVCFLALFFFISLLPVIGWQSQATPYGNETLTEKPVLFTKEGIDRNFFEQLNRYLSEHIGFRGELITAEHLLSLLFGETGEESVLAGKDGFLFLADTLPDYKGENALSEQELARLETVLFLMQEYVEKNGGHFLFLIAPNKNSIYGEYMNACYGTALKANTLDRWNERAKWAGLSYLNAKECLLAAKAGGVLLYHKEDTHWNNLGARFVYRAVMEKFERPPLLEVTGFTEEAVWEGDLSAMLFPALAKKDLQMVYPDSFSFSYTSPFRTDMDLEIETRKEGGSGSLLFFRDSFGSALYPLFAEEYEETFVSRVVPYEIYRAEDGADVVLEIAERNLRNLLLVPPVLTAPERMPQTPDGELVSGGKAAVRETKEYYQLTGRIGIEASRIYVGLAKEDGETCFYEAFPIESTELFSEAFSEEQPLLTGETGFTLYFEKDNRKIGDFKELTVLAESGGRWYRGTLKEDVRLLEDSSEGFKESGEEEKAGKQQREAAQAHLKELAGKQSYTFAYEGILLPVGAKMEEALLVLPEPLRIAETPSCIGNGYDRLYVFDGFQIATIPQGGNDVIQEISVEWEQIEAGKYAATPEGLSLPADKEEVKACYGSDGQQAGALLRYRTGEASYLYFYMEADKAVSYGYCYGTLGEETVPPAPTQTPEITPTSLPETDLRSMAERLADEVLEEILEPDMAPEEKMRAVYVWVEENITYHNTDTFYLTGNLNAYVEELAEYALLNRKGKCYHMAALNALLLRRLGFETVVLRGEAWDRRENTAFSEHGWCEVYYDGEYRLFDSNMDALIEEDLYLAKKEQFQDIYYRWEEAEYPY